MSLKIDQHENSDKAHLEAENLPLSIEQPDVLRTGLDTSALQTIRLGPSMKDKRREMLNNVATQYGIGAAIRRQADLKLVEQYHRYVQLSLVETL